MGKLDGMVALVTGSGSGIGRAIAGAMAAEGAAVAINARTGADVEAAAAEIAAETGARTLAAAADVSDPATVEELIATVERELGPVDILVNNAGTSGPAVFAQQVTPEQFMEVLRVNVLGTFLCTRAVLPGMIERRRGRLINLSGAGGQGSIKGGIAYGTSKGAVEAFTRTIAAEVERFGVTCNAIQPGRVDTRGFPLGEQAPEALRRIAVGPELAAGVAVWLAAAEDGAVNGDTVSAIEWSQTHDA